MKIFDIDYDRFLSWLPPIRLRKSKMLSWLKVLIYPVVRLYGLFQLNREQNLYKVSHRQHVAHLEAVLNDRWDMAMRRITVIDGPLDYQPVMIYKNVENKPQYIYRISEDQPKFIFTEHETLFAGIDFVVHVPVSIPYDVEEMRATVNYYKPPGMGFAIEDI